MANDTIIGIDLGTTNSCVFVSKNGKYEVIENNVGARTTPSVVYIGKDDKIIVGEAAKRQAALSPESVIYCVKRLMGKKFNEIDKKYISSLPYKVVEGKDGKACVRVNGKIYTPEQISGYILSYLKESAEDKLGVKINSAVITVPAYFNDAQRQATIDSGKIANLDVKRIINEPTAAALSYGVDKNKNEVVAVYDLGGGTFDVSILEISNQGVIEVKSTGGDSFLGGEDFDNTIVDYINGKFIKDYGVDLKKDPKSLYKLKEAAENAKKELSSAEQVEISIPYVDGKNHLMYTFTRIELESMTSHLRDRTKPSCKDAIDQSGCKRIDKVLLVGGATRMPSVRKTVEEIFNISPSKEVNPDEAVAYGAAVQGDIISGRAEGKVLLIDVTPLNLGIETLGGVCTPIIERNSSIPCSMSKVFSTAEDNQTGVGITILEGDRPMAKDNRILGSFVLDGILPAPRGVPQIEVTFSIDQNGVLSVSSVDKGTGKSKSITLESSGKLSQEEIERMRKEAEENQELDRKKESYAIALNAANFHISKANELLSKTENKKELEDLINSVKDEITASNTKINANEGNAYDTSALNLKTAELARKVVEIEQQCKSCEGKNE